MNELQSQSPCLPAARGRWILVTALLLALYLGVGVFDHDIWSPTEPAVAGVVWNMFRNGDLATPRIHDFLYLEKPPLNYWISLLCCKLAGRLDAGWIRLPSPLHGLLCLLLTAWTLRRRVVPDALLTLLPLAATGVFFYEISHRAGSDALATVLSFACWAIFLRSLSLDPAETRRRFRLDAAFALLLAASFYAKNFYTYLVVLPPVFLFLLIRRQFRRGFRLGLMLGAFSVLLVLPWAMALHAQGGWDYLRVVFVDNTFGRFLPLADLRTPGVTPLNDAYVAEKDLSPALYLETLLNFSIPWVLFYAAAFAALFRRRDPRDDFRLFLRIALIAVPLVLTLSASRVIEYLAPLFFIYFLAAGEFLSGWLSGSRPLSTGERRLLAANAFLVAAALMAAPIALAWILRRPALALWVLPFALALAALFRRRAHVRLLAFAFPLFSAAAMGALLFHAYPALEELKSYRFFFEDIREAAAGRELFTTFCDDRRLPLLSYYLDQPVPPIPERDIDALAGGGRRIGLILPPSLYEQHLESLQASRPLVIEARRGKTGAFVFVGLPAE